MNRISGTVVFLVGTTLLIAGNAALPVYEPSTRYAARWMILYTIRLFRYG